MSNEFCTVTRSRYVVSPCRVLRNSQFYFSIEDRDVPTSQTSRGCQALSISVRFGKVVRGVDMWVYDFFVSICYGFGLLVGRGFLLCVSSFFPFLLPVPLVFKRCLRLLFSILFFRPLLPSTCVGMCFRLRRRRCGGALGCSLVLRFPILCVCVLLCSFFF